MKSIKAIRVDLPSHLFTRLDYYSKDKWGEQSRIIRNGLKLILDKLDEERKILTDIKEGKYATDNRLVTEDKTPLNTRGRIT